MSTFEIEGKTFEIEYIHTFANGGVAHVAGLNLDLIHPESEIDLACGLVDITNNNKSITHKIGSIKKIEGLDFVFAITEIQK